MKQNVKLIMACNHNGVIAANRRIPWGSRSDMIHFKKSTMGKTIIMGRKTFDTLPQALHGRENIILTKTMSSLNDGTRNVHHVHSVKGALSTAEYLNKPVMIIGGREIYSLFLNYVDELIISVIDWREEHRYLKRELTYAPENLYDGFELKSTTHVPRGPKDFCSMNIETYERMS